MYKGFIRGAKLKGDPKGWGNCYSS